MIEIEWEWKRGGRGGGPHGSIVLLLCKLGRRNNGAYYRSLFG
jgi:hypothetical protein